MRYLCYSQTADLIADGTAAEVALELLRRCTPRELQDVEVRLPEIQQRAHAGEWERKTAEFSRRDIWAAFSQAALHADEPHLAAEGETD